jgi:uncharacterized protein (TIGR00251 family)
MHIEVTVVPRSSRFKIKQENGKLRVYLKSAPESNKANIELVKELKKLLNAEIRIVAGHHSRKKTLEIPLAEEELKRLLPNL